MAMVGCDPDELKKLADLFGSTGISINTIDGETTATIRELEWFGGDADFVRSRWRNAVEPEFERITNSFRKLEEALRANAEAQIEVSKWLNLTGAAGGTNTFFPPGQCLTPQAEKELLEKFLQLSPEEQRKLWDSLSESERQKLIAAYPEHVLRMKGLPDSVYQLARISFARNQDIEISRSDASIAVEGNVLWVDFGIEGSGSIKHTSNPEFPYEVTLTLDGKVGATVGNTGAVGATGGVEQTYKFKTREEAEAFLQGLKDELIPTAGEGFKESLQFWNGGVAGDAATDAKRYLDGFADHRTANEVHVGAYGSAELKFPGGEVEIEGSGGFAYDLDSNTRSAYLDMHASGEVELGAFEVSGEVEMSMKMSLDENNHPTTLEIDLSGQMGGEFLDVDGVDVGVAEAELESRSGVEGRAHLEVDMGNSRNQELVRQLIASGGPSSPAGQAALAQLCDNSTMVMQTAAYAETTATVGVDLKAASFEVEGSSSKHLTTSTFVKPPGSTFYSVSNKELTGGN